MKKVSLPQRAVYLLLAICLTINLPTHAVAAPAYQDNDQKAQANTLFNEGYALFQAGQRQAALDKLAVALPLYRKVGDRHGEALCLLLLGYVKDSLADYPGALEAYKASLIIWRELRNRAKEGDTLHNIASAYESLGQYEQALDFYQQALTIANEIDDQEGAGTTLNGIGAVYYHLGRYHEALETYQQALKIIQAAGNQEGEDALLNNIGLLYDHFGNYALALQNYQQALKIARAIGDQDGEETALANIGAIYINLGRYAEALTNYQQALKIVQAIGDRAGEGRILNNIAVISDDLGRYEQSLALYQRALAIKQAIGDRAGEGTTLNNIGLANSNLGRYEQALAIYQQALTIQQQIGNRAGEGTTLSNIAMAYAQLRRYVQALETYQQALDILQEVGDLAAVRSTFDGIARIYERLGRYDLMLTSYQQMLKITQEMGDKMREGRALNNMAAVYYHLGRYQPALEVLQQALTIAKANRDRVAEGTALNNMAEDYRKLGRYDQALESNLQALTIAEDIGDRAGKGTTLNNIGLVYSHLGRYAKALESYQQALAIARETGNWVDESYALGNLGTLYKTQNDTAQAILYYQQSIAVRESIQRTIGVEELKASFIASDPTNVYERLIDLLWKANRLEEGFGYIERARARSFLDQIGNQQIDYRQGAASALIQQEQALRQHIVGLQNALNAEQVKPFDRQSQELLHTLGANLDQARKQYGELLIRLKSTNPEYASLVSVNTLNLSEVQHSVLDAKTTLVEYFVMGDHTLVWVINPNDFQVIRLDMPRDDLMRQVTFLRDLIDKKESDNAAFAALYKAIFAPLKPYIRQPNLIIVPHGVLHYLPFAALWNADQKRYLIEEYALTYAPSASALQYIFAKRNPNRGRLLALGNPDGSLPNTENEARAVAQLYAVQPMLRKQATESQIYLQAGKSDVIHLAAHGLYDPFNPRFTRIELAPDADQDGKLEVHEVYHLNLADTNLVVLSACDTGKGSLSNGDEIVGLSQAFIYAGAPAIITSLWSIDDVASAMLMTSFYRHWRAGETTAAALQTAQKEVLAQAKWRSPYYWSAFSLNGDYRGGSQ